MKYPDIDNANRPDSVPYIVYEMEQMRCERRDIRHWIAHFISLVAIVLVVAGFLLYLNQYEFVSNESVMVDGESGVANYIGKDGNIYNGEDYSQANPTEAEEVGELERNP